MSNISPLAPSLQFARPRLKSGQIFGSLLGDSRESTLLFELADGSRQVSLPPEAARILPLLDGSLTVPDILDALHRTYGRVPFKSFFSTLQKLQIQGCLEGAEGLATEDAQKRLESFERERIWLNRPIFSWRIAPAKILGEPSVLAFGLFAVGTLIVTLSFLFGAIALGLVRVPTSFLRIHESYVQGVLFFFASASILVTAKTLVKTILSLLLTGARSELKLELGLFSLAVRSEDAKIYMAGGRALGTLAFAAVASSYFFIFAVASAVAPHWASLDDLFWVSAILAMIDLNPFRKSDLSSFFNIVYNQRSVPDLLPYLQHRGLVSSKKNAKINDTAIYAAFSTIAVFWTMVAYNLLLALINRNDSILLTNLLRTLREGPAAEFLATLIVAVSLGLTFIYLVVDLFTILVKNILFPLRPTRLAKKSLKTTTSDIVENAQAVARAINHIPLFNGLHPDAIFFLLSKGHARKIKKGTHVIVQGTYSDELFILIEGEVSVIKNHATGAAKEITRLQAPTVFGENTLLAHGLRSADVIATENSRVIAVSRKSVDEFLNHPTLRSEAETMLDRLMLGQYISSSELFRDAPSEVVSLFLNEGQLLSVATGRHVIEQGRTDKDFYLLVRGSVDVIRDGQIVAHLQQGDFFGETALILDAPRSATIMTREPSRLLKLSSQQFWKVVSQHAELALYLENVSENRVEDFCGVAP